MDLMVKTDLGSDGNVVRWTEQETRNAEKESLGLYLSSHPLNSCKEKLQQLSTASSSEISELPEGGNIIIGGIITALKPSTTKRGDPMLYITLEELAFKEVYMIVKHVLIMLNLKICK